MSNLDLEKEHVKMPPTPTPMPSAPPSTVSPATDRNTTTPSVTRLKRRDILNKGSLVLKWLGFLFSFLAFILMVSNRHGEPTNFEDYPEYSYVLAITIMSTLYTAIQGIRQTVQLGSGKSLSNQRVLAIVDFVGDQIFAYLLISAASAASPWTNKAREDYGGRGYSKVDMFIGMAGASISMTFLAFFASAASAIMSGYNLSYNI